MTDLFDKLNLLLRSSLDSLIDGISGAGDPGAARVQLDPAALRDPRAVAEVERKIGAMRKQIDAALSEEDKMQERLDDMLRQVQVYDQQADAALEQGNEQEARRFVGQMQQQRHRAAMLAAQLDEHRGATSAFIERVNMLEAMVVDAKQMQQAVAPLDAGADEHAGQSDEVEQQMPPQKHASGERADFGSIQLPPALAEQIDQIGHLGKVTGAKLNDLLQTVRERAETVLSPILPHPDATPAAPTDPETLTAPAAGTPDPVAKPDQSDEIDADLARRRERLSKPD